MLAFLARHAGRTCTHQMILSAVWGTGYGREAGYLHAYVHRLRQKLGDGSANADPDRARDRLQPGRRHGQHRRGRAMIRTGVSGGVLGTGPGGGGRRHAPPRPPVDRP